MGPWLLAFGFAVPIRIYHSPSAGWIAITTC